MKIGPMREFLLHIRFVAGTINISWTSSFRRQSSSRLKCNVSDAFSAHRRTLKESHGVGRGSEGWGFVYGGSIVSREAKKRCAVSCLFNGFRILPQNRFFGERVPSALSLFFKARSLTREHHLPCDSKKKEREGDRDGSWLIFFFVSHPLHHRLDQSFQSPQLLRWTWQI